MEEPKLQFCKVKKRPFGKVDSYQIWIKNILLQDKSSAAWSFISLSNKKEIITMNGIEKNTDKYRSQLIPLLEALEWVCDSEDKMKEITIFTDSNYIVSIIQEWLDKWKKTNFMINNEDERPNADILRKLGVFKNVVSLSVKFLMKTTEYSKWSEKLCEELIAKSD